MRARGARLDAAGSGAPAATRAGAMRVLALAARGLLAGDRSALVVLLLGFSVVAYGLGELEQDAVLPAAPPGTAVLALCALIEGWIVGVLQVERERGARTAAYLAHRGKAWTAWAAAGVAGAAAGLAAASLPVLVAYARAEGIEVRPLLLVCTVALAGQGLGAFVSTWRGPVAVRFALGGLVLLGAGRALLAWLGFDGFERDVALLLFAAGSVVLGAGAWTLAGSRLVRIDDDARIARGPAGVLTAIAAVALVVPPLRWIAGTAGDLARGRILDCSLQLPPGEEAAPGAACAGTHVDGPLDRGLRCRDLESEARIAEDLHVLRRPNASARGRALADRGVRTVRAPFGRLVVLNAGPPWTSSTRGHDGPWLDRGSGRVIASDGEVLAEVSRAATVVSAKRGTGEPPGGLLIADASTGGTPRLSDPDLLEPRVVVVDPATGRTLLEHAHASAWRRPLAAGVAYAASLALGPLGAVRAYASDVDPHVARERAFLDPLLASGRRSRLLAVHVALAVLVCGWILRRVGGGARGWLWCSAAAALGPWTLGAFALVEPRRPPRARADAPRRARIATPRAR